MDEKKKYFFGIFLWIMLWPLISAQKLVFFFQNL